MYNRLFYCSVRNYHKFSGMKYTNLLSTVLEFKSKSVTILKSNVDSLHSSPEALGKNLFPNYLGF